MVFFTLKIYLSIYYIYYLIGESFSFDIYICISFF